MLRLSQKDILLEIKELLGGTWDDVAEATKIDPRTLKSYRLPEESKGYREMKYWIRQGVEGILTKLKNGDS